MVSSPEWMSLREWEFEWNW